MRCDMPQVLLDLRPFMADNKNAGSEELEEMARKRRELIAKKVSDESRAAGIDPEAHHMAGQVRYPAKPPRPPCAATLLRAHP